MPMKGLSPMGGCALSSCSSHRSFTTLDSQVTSFNKFYECFPNEWLKNDMGRCWLVVDPND